MMSTDSPERTSTQAGPGHAISDSVKSLAQALMQKAKIQGLSIGVVHPDNSVELAALGIRTEVGDAMTTDTTLVIASCTKAFLTAAVGILIDDFAKGLNTTALPPTVQKLDWYTKVADLLPDDWRLMDEWATQKATLRDIFSHQSGLPRHDFTYKPSDKPLDVIHRMRHLRPAFELRQRWHYNNQMFVLGAHLISTYAGMPYIDYVQERIFGPLSMTSTTFRPSKALQTGKRSEAWHEDGRRIPFWWSEDMVELNAGQGGIISSVEDMTKWIRMMLNEGVDPATEKIVLPRSAYMEITSDQAMVERRTSQSYLSPETYALGWRHKSYQGHELFYHGGEIPGFSAEVAFLPSDKLGVVVLANGGGKHNEERAVIFRIIEDYLQLPHKESARLTGLTLNTQPPPFSPAAPATPPTLALTAYAGQYYYAGYGMLTLCAPEPSPPPERARVLAAFALFYDTSPAGPRALYATVPWLLGSHVRLAHLCGEAFALHVSTLFPEGYGRDGSPFEMAESENAGFRAEFVVERGKVVGLALGGFVGEVTNPQRRGGSLLETAEVWFDKV